MYQVADNLVLFLKTAQLYVSEIKKVDGQKSEYTIVFKTGKPQSHSVVSLTLNFMFDMDSFIIRYKELYPDHNANESFVLDGISEFFYEVADHVLIMGAQGYDEFADKIHKFKGQVHGRNFGV